MDKRTQIIIAALFGFSGVALGAFGAHGLRSVIPAELLETYKTGILYHLIHSSVLLAISFSKFKLNTSFIFISIGIILFSFSLYFLAITGFSKLGIITPFGGTAFLAGWIFIIFEVIKESKLDTKD